MAEARPQTSAASWTEPEGLLARGTVSGVDALILAGLPADGRAGDTAPADWDDELGARTTCPTHRGRLAGGLVRPGALYEPVPEGWADRAERRPGIRHRHHPRRA